MTEELLRELKIITPEERQILSGTPKEIFAGAESGGKSDLDYPQPPAQ